MFIAISEDPLQISAPTSGGLQTPVIPKIHTMPPQASESTHTHKLKNSNITQLINKIMGKTHQVPMESSIQTYGHSGNLVKHKNIRKGLVRRGVWETMG